MSILLQNTFSNSDLLNQVKSVTDRKYLCNVTFYCSNGMLFHNKLIVGLVFPVLEIVEQFSMMQEVVVIVPGFTVKQVKVKIEQCVSKLFEEKAVSEDEDIKDMLSDNLAFIQNKVEPVHIKIEGSNDLSVEGIDFSKNPMIKIEDNVATKVEEEEEFLKLVKHVSDSCKLVDGSDGSLIKCNICEKTFRKGRVSQHVARNHCTTKYQCPFCDHFRGTRKYMKMHITKNHPELTIRGKSSGHCSFCNKNVSKLSEHTKRVHLKLKEFSCNLCALEFYDKHDLDKHHKKVHEDQKEVCQECGLSFKRIQMHIKTVHRKDYVKEVCPECGKSFSQHQLKEHIRSVHEKEKNFSCHLCPLKMYKKTTLKTHLGVHEKYASMDKSYLPPPKPKYRLENLEKATGLVAAGKISRRKAAKLFKLSVHDIKKATLRVEGAKT